MKVLYVASEAVPFAKSGGLGDVAGALPAALRKKLVGVRVVLPLYQEIRQDLKDQLHFVKEIWVPLSWRSQYCGIFEAKIGGVVYYLLDNQYYFGRRGFYGHYDDAERFAFFSKAVLELLQHIDYEPDVINCNDWQTGMLPFYLNKFYRNINDCYRHLQVVYTIHNIQYQGVFPSDIVENVLGLDWQDYAGGYIQFDNCVNYMKTGIMAATAVTTVSPTYAGEIQNAYYGHGLQGLLQKENAKLSGIINGIDYEVYDPETDPHLFKNYTVETMQEKAVNKTELQKLLNLPVNAEIPMIGMVTRLVDHKGMDLVARVLDEILADDVQLVVLGTGDWQYEEMLRRAAENYPRKVSANITFNSDLAQKIYAGADIFLMPSQSEPCGLAQMIAMRYGTIPVVRETGGLKDTVSPYISWEGRGTGFTFADYNAHDMLYVIRQAEETYRSPQQWKTLMTNAMTQDFSWSGPAKEYLALYRRITGKR
ncbi:MAG: glycogen synthase GlgA [Lachnospiraceae bacterium]|jgi:starch synthase|nr:glycogen synthase GlgA [Lachnospiraceae bacterium]